MMTKEIATFSDFQKLELRAGTIIHAEPVPGSEKLLKMEVDLGYEKRQILGGLASYFTPPELEGKQVVVLVNLEPKIMMGFESQGMLLAADFGEKPILISPEIKVPNGALVR